MSVVATVFERMLNRHAGKPYPKTLRAIIVGGGPVPAPLLARCEQAYATYGLSEAGSMVTCARPGCSDEERASAGPPLPGTDVKIVDTRGKDVKGEAEGEILVRGPGMAPFYYGDREASARTFKGGWMHTGDLGHRDAHGCLHVHARRSDLVLSGGENIYPAEIEAALKEHARDHAAVVLPLESSEWGQVPAAFIVLFAGPPADQNPHLPASRRTASRATSFPACSSLPTTLPLLPTGKPDLMTIRKRLADEKP